MHNMRYSRYCFCRCPLHGNTIEVTVDQKAHAPRYTSEKPFWHCAKCGIVFKQDDKGFEIPGEDCNNGDHKQDDSNVPPLQENSTGA